MSDLLKQLAAMRPNSGQPEVPNKPIPDAEWEDTRKFKCGLCHTEFMKRSQLESHAIGCKVKPEETADKPIT